MKKYRRRDLKGKYFIIEVFECPKELLLLAAQEGSENITVENFTHYGRQRAEIKFEIHSCELYLIPNLKKYDVDFTITKNEFVQFIDVWDENGCYAVFHVATSLKFKATDLPEFKRYQALDNFSWNIEMAIPSSASDGWGQITSPNKQIIDKLEEHLKMTLFYLKK